MALFFTRSISIPAPSSAKEIAVLPVWEKLQIVIKPIGDLPRDFLISGDSIP